MDSVPPPFGKTTETLRGRISAPHQFSQLMLAAWACPGLIRSFTTFPATELAATVPEFPSTSKMGVVASSQTDGEMFKSVIAPWVSFVGASVFRAPLESWSEVFVHGGAEAATGGELVGGTTAPRGTGVAGGRAATGGADRPLVGACASPKPIPRALPNASRTSNAKGVTRWSLVTPDPPWETTPSP